MAPKRKGKAAAQFDGAELVGAWVGVPTSFFGVEIEGARYLGRVKERHAQKKGMLTMRFVSDGQLVYALRSGS